MRWILSPTKSCYLNTRKSFEGSATCLQQNSYVVHSDVNYVIQIIYHKSPPLTSATSPPFPYYHAPHFPSLPTLPIVSLSSLLLHVKNYDRQTNMFAKSTFYDSEGLNTSRIYENWIDQSSQKSNIRHHKWSECKN